MEAPLFLAATSDPYPGDQMRFIPMFACLLMPLAFAFAQGSKGGPGEQAKALIGTWRFQEFTYIDATGKWITPYGDHPRGYLTYDPTGHMQVQIMKTPPLAPFPEVKTPAGPPSAEHALEAYIAYVAYFGTYTVDEQKHVVTHHVEGSMFPDFTATDQPRPFKLQGDRLELGDGKTWRVVLERVR
jgi:hypothetical protein